MRDLLRVVTVLLFNRNHCTDLVVALVNSLEIVSERGRAPACFNLEIVTFIQWAGFVSGVAIWR